MNNADLPAYPQAHETSLDLDQGHWFDWLGLTKREHFVAMAMQGLLANPGLVDIDAKNIVKEAIEHADELLKQLDETDTQKQESGSSGTGSSPETFKPTTS